MQSNKVKLIEGVFCLFLVNKTINVVSLEKKVSLKINVST